MTSSAPLRVLLADDHAIVRKGGREFLEQDDEVAVVAEASGGVEAVRLAAVVDSHAAFAGLRGLVRGSLKRTGSPGPR